MIAALGPACSTEEAFEQMVLEYQMPLKRMCYMYLHDMTLAEDAVQETFLKVYRSLPQFGGGLLALRRSVEEAGGSMSVESSPAFVLEIRFPETQ